MDFDGIQGIMLLCAYLSNSGSWKKAILFTVYNTNKTTVIMGMQISIFLYLLNINLLLIFTRIT